MAKRDHKTKAITRELPVAMRPERLSGAKDDLAHITNEQTALETELEAFCSVKRKRLREIRKEQRRLSRDIEARTEMQEVACEERRYFSQNKIEVVRLDTREVVETRAMKGDERQEEIDTEAGEQIDLGEGAH